jgi:hypothetical protein
MELVEEIGRERAGEGAAAALRSPSWWAIVAAGGSTTGVPQNGHEMLASGMGVRQDMQRMKCAAYPNTRALCRH